MPAEGNQKGASDLKTEHESFRRKVAQVDKVLGGIDEELAIAQQEKLKELRDKLFHLHDTLVYLKGDAASHERKEMKLLIEHQPRKIARALKNQHDEILQALEQSIRVIGEALPENASREQLRESSIIVQNIFYGTVGMVMKHMSGEDALIDMMAAGDNSRTPSSK